MNPTPANRRDFFRTLGVSAAALPFVANLPSLAFANQARRKQRMVVMFSPNGVVPGTFWPKKYNDKLELNTSLKPLEPFVSKTLMLNGVADRIGGDGDSHMRGIGCLLTGVELYPGNIQGGSHTPAGWAKGHSIDQEIRSFLQKDAATKTRFGSLEFGVMVPDRADTWTRMSYAAANKPITPIDDPYQMFNKLYGRVKDREVLGSILDDLQADLKKVKDVVSTEDKRLLEEHSNFVRELEQELKAAKSDTRNHPVPPLEPGIKQENDRIPQISKMQIDLMVSSFVADMTRVATLQYTNSVGMAKMRWLGIEEGHHELSHEPDNNKKAQEKLTNINTWFAEQLAYLAKRLAETSEPGGPGSMLDNTLIVWTNELGQGNSHTLDNIPFVLVGGGMNFKMGRALQYKREPHNRLLLSLAHGFGHHLTTFGNPDYSKAGPLTNLT
ncbi:MAG: DUF1552 domain-containing protein [Gemmataceae bacterium]